MEAACAIDVPNQILLELLAFLIASLFEGDFFSPRGQKHSLTILICQSYLNHGWIRIGFAILLIGKRSIHGLRYVEEKGAHPLPP
jgi:hypothetical protein